MIQLRNVIAGISVFFSIATAHAGACSLAPLSIGPIAPGRINTFVGKTNGIEVRFINERTEGNIDVFPEPPLTIQNNTTNTTCTIDGGVWVRKSVFVSTDGAVLVTQEYSGSNDFLNFYDTHNCEKLHTIDVSNSAWEIHGW